MHYHEKHGHRSVGSVYYAIKFYYYWPGIKNDIEKVIRKCENAKYTIEKSQVDVISLVLVNI